MKTSTLFLSLSILLIMGLTLAYMLAIPDQYMTDLAAEHYRCMQLRTEHCLHIELEYMRANKVIDNQ